MQKKSIEVLVFNQIIEQIDLFNEKANCNYASNIDEIANIIAKKKIDLIILNVLSNENCTEVIRMFKDTPIIFTIGPDNEKIISEVILENIVSYTIRDEKGRYLVILEALIKKILKDLTKSILKEESTINEYENTEYYKEITLVLETDNLSTLRNTERIFENKLLLETVISNAPLIMYFVDNYGVIKLAKGKGLESINIKEKDVINRNIYEAYPETYKLSKIYSDVLKGKTYRGIVEFNDISLDGWISPLIDNKGNIEGAISVAFDITALSKTEKALQQSEEKYWSLIENSPIGILFSDTKGNILDVNKTLIDVLGSPSIEATKKINILKFKNLIDIGFDKDFNKCLETKSLVISEVLYRSVWGKAIYIRYHLTCIYDSDKNVIGIQALVEDINERKLAEIALKESEELYKTLSKNLPNASVLLFDKNLNYKIAEGKAFDIKERNYLKSLDNLEESKKSIFTSEYFEKYYLESLEGKISSFEKQYGENIYLIHILPVKNDKNKIFAGMAVFQDVTEQKKYEEQIKSSLREKELLLKEINHRVKNNLQIISSLLSLQSGYIKDKTILEIFRESQNRVKSMALVHEELYKSEKISRIEFRQYAENITNHLYQSYRISSGKIVFNINSNDIVLDIETSIPVGLIINELVSNSLKYAFENEQIGEISVSLNKNNNIFELIVADNGIGLPENLDFMNTTSLGLQLIVSLTEQLDGTINLDRNNGTKFIIKFEELNYKERY